MSPQTASSRCPRDPDGTTVGANLWVDLGVVAGSTVGAIALATWLVYRKR